METPALKSPILKNIPHGFYSRQGGCSEGLYTSLNCGLSSQDNPVHILQNREIVRQQMGGGALKLCGLKQIHSNIVHKLDKPWNNDNMPEGDAMVSQNPDVILAILTADCAPVLLADPQAGIIGAAHAGWKGAHLGIIENSIKAMCLIGAKRHNIRAAIGPCIHQQSYEVGPEFFSRLSAEHKDYQNFFQPSDQENHHLFDLESFVENKLLKSEVSQIDKIGQDTYRQDSRFFSYRRSTHNHEKDYGRQISVISLA